MVRPGIEIEGLRQVVRSFKAAEDAAGLAMLKAAHKTAAEAVVQRALPNVPVLTGRLYASVRALGSPTKGTAKAGGARVPYALPVHYGWPRRGIRRQAFLLDALDAMQAEIPEMFQEVVERDVLSRFR